MISLLQPAHNNLAIPVYNLYAAGVRQIIRETFDSSVRMGRSAYEMLGVHPFDAELMAKKFSEDDRHIIQILAELHDPDIPVEQNTAYIEKSKELMEEREAKIFGKGNAFGVDANTGWLPPGRKNSDA